MTRLKPLLWVLLLAIVISVVAIGLLQRKTTDSQTVTSITPSVIEQSPLETSTEDLPTAEPVVSVNGVNISRDEWEMATKLDTTLNALAGFPPPSAESTLDGLVNAVLVLSESNESPADISDADAESRLNALLKGQNISTVQLESALADAGATRVDLLERVKQLMVMEATLNQVPSKDGGADWLKQIRASAEISLYQALPDQLAQLPTATATATLLPVATATLGVEEGSSCSTCGKATPEPSPTPIVVPDLPISPQPGNLAPDFTLATLDGSSLTLSELRGKPTIINFWATWCPPCRQELPALESTFENYRDRINFVAVNLQESADTVEPFATQMGLTFPIVLDTSGEVSNVKYQVRGIPTTLFVDSQGVVAIRHVGPLDKSTIEQYLLPLFETED